MSKVVICPIEEMDALDKAVVANAYEVETTVLVPVMPAQLLHAIADCMDALTEADLVIELENGARSVYLRDDDLDGNLVGVVVKLPHLPDVMYVPLAQSREFVDTVARMNKEVHGD